MEILGTFETAEARGQGVPRRNVTPRADDAHPRPGAQGSDRLPDPAGADDTHGLAFDLDWPVGTVIELLLLLVASRPVQPASEVEKAGQDILGHRPGVAVAARRGDRDITAPQIPTQQIAGPRRALMKPLETWRPRSQIEGERPAAQDHLGLSQELVALRSRAGWTGALAQVALHSPLGPGLPDLVVEPPAGVDDVKPCVEACDLRELVIPNRLDDQDVDRCGAPGPYSTAPTRFASVGVAIPAFQVGSRTSSRLPEGSRKYSSRPVKKPCSRYVSSSIFTPRSWKSRTAFSHSRGERVKE